MAAELVQKAMEEIDFDRQVCLCCDSWYPKGEILNLPEQFANLTLICNVRHDTVLYDLTSASAHHRGRPRIRGEKISLADFACKPIKGTDFFASADYLCPSMTYRNCLLRTGKFWSLGKHMLRGAISNFV